LFKAGSELAPERHLLIIPISNVKAVILHYTIFANNVNVSNPESHASNTVCADTAVQR